MTQHARCASRRLLAGLAMMCSAALSAQTLFEAGDDLPPVVCPPGRPATFTMTDVAGRRAMQCHREATVGAFGEFSFRTTLAFPARRLTDAYRGDLVLDVYLPEDANIKNISLRVMDRNEEFLQITATTKLVPGWQTLVYPLDTTRPNNNSWGYKDNVDHLYDLPLALSSIAFSFNTLDAAASLAIGKVAFRATDARLTNDVDTGSPVHVLRPEDDAVLALSFRNPGIHERRITGTATMTNAWGERLAEIPLDHSLAPEGTARVPLAAPPSLGVFYLDLKYHDGIAENSRQLSFARMRPAGPTPGKAEGFIFAICGHPQAYPLREQELEAMAAGLCGCKVLRGGYGWPEIQRTPEPIYDFSNADRLLDLFAKNGIELQPCFLNTPRWAVDPDWKPFNPDLKTRSNSRGVPPPVISHYENFVEVYMRHYDGRIRFLESWNEPDLLNFANFSADTYVEIMKAFHRAIRRVSPTAQVMTGGYTCISLPYPRLTSHPDYMAYTMEQAKGHYDIHAFHAHGSHLHYYPQIYALKELHRKLGIDIPWWANETAISAINIGELAQAATLWQKLLFSFAEGAMGYTWYDLRNDGYDPLENEHNFGLVTKDFYPKAVYAAYNTLATYYGGATFVRQLAADKEFQAYLFKAANGDYLLACWNIRLNQPSRILTIDQITGSLHMVDLFGNETPVPVAQNVAFIEAGRHPVTLRISGQTQEPRQAPAIASLPGDIVLTPGVDSTFAIACRNPLDRALNLAIALTAPTGMTIAPTIAELSLPADASQQLPFTLKAIPGFQASPRDQPLLNVSIAVGNNVACTIAAPVRIVRKMAGLDGAPDFVLDTAAQVNSCVINEPGTTHLFWTGKDDLSAELRLGKSDDAMIVEVIVHDDKHEQPFTGQDVWKADNVQLAFQLPGQASCWEIGLTHLADGTAQACCWAAPKGQDAARASQHIALKTSRDDTAKITRYHAVIPAAAIGLAADAHTPIPFNLLVNDSDAGTRESFIAIAPGFGFGKHDTPLFPLISF